MKSFTKSHGDRGATMVEYGLVTALISLLSFSAVTLVGDSTEESFDDVAVALEASPGGGVGPVSAPGGGGSGGPGGGGGGSATTTTTLPPATTTTTAPTTTTTTAAPTTTTTLPPATTTTTAAPAEAGGSSTAASPSGSDFTWWNNTKHGGNGEWKASVEFSNDWIRHQYLTLEITEIDHKGRKKTKTVEGFYVPAGGSATFDHWGNDLKDHKGKITGVVEVQVEVVFITTSDEGWNPVDYPQDGGTVTSVTPPDLP